MKKSGITRRIDELGRIVIPKEIRKNLKIRDSDELEISVRDGNIILNKYEIMEKDKTIETLLYTINKVLHKNILFTSKDSVIDYYLENKIELNNKYLSNSVIKIIEHRKVINSPMTKISIFDDVIEASYIISPIIINGDLLGSTILYSEKDNIDDLDISIMGFVNLFLEKYLE